MHFWVNSASTRAHTHTHTSSYWWTVSMTDFGKQRGNWAIRKTSKQKHCTETLFNSMKGAVHACQEHLSLYKCSLVFTSSPQTENPFFRKSGSEAKQSNSNSGWRRCLCSPMGPLSWRLSQVLCAWPPWRARVSCKLHGRAQPSPEICHLGMGYAVTSPVASPSHHTERGHATHTKMPAFPPPRHRPFQGSWSHGTNIPGISRMRGWGRECDCLNAKATWVS